MNKFIPLKNFLGENKSEDNNYGCVMLFADVPDWDKLIKRIVKEKDLYNSIDEPDEYGYEEKPHITLIYGIHHDELLDESIVYNKIKEISEMTFTIKEIDIFDNSDNDKPFDVVKFHIKPTKTLLKHRKDFMELPNTQSFKGYHPHITIAYVKKEAGKKHKRILKNPIKFKFDKGVYSDPKYRKSYFDLKTSDYEK